MIFDCCSGHHQQERLSFSDDTGKGTDRGNSDNGSLSKPSEQNLDYKLAIVQAANPGLICSNGTFVKYKYLALIMIDRIPIKDQVRCGFLRGPLILYQNNACFIEKEKDIFIRDI